MITYMTIGLIAMTGILMVLLILWSKLRYFYISYCLGIASDRYHCDIVLRVDFSPCWGSCCCCRLILIFFSARVFLGLLLFIWVLTDCSPRFVSVQSFSYHLISRLCFYRCKLAYFDPPIIVSSFIAIITVISVTVFIIISPATSLIPPSRMYILLKIFKFYNLAIASKYDN